MALGTGLTGVHSVTLHTRLGPAFCHASQETRILEKGLRVCGGHAGLSQADPGQEPEAEKPRAQGAPGEPAPQQAEDGASLGLALQPAGPDWRFSKEGRPNGKPCNVLVQVRDDIFEDFMVFLWEFLEYLLKGV